MIIKNVLKRIASICLLLAILLSAVGSILQYSYAATNSYDGLGSNKMLGSPVLNPNFVTDDWNSWEMVVWGIFLSNFAVPFVDDYNSAFNKDAGFGSKGSGAKALQFASGNDVANTKIIQDLVDYAINQQTQNGAKQIYVDYSSISDMKFTDEKPFVTQEGYDESPIRAATLADLFFTSAEAGAEAKKTITWVEQTKEVWYSSGHGYNNNPRYVYNYPHIATVNNATVPTFALMLNNNVPEIIFDFRDSYDLSVWNLVLSKSLGGDYKDETLSIIDNLIKYKDTFNLYLDCFGNICVLYDGTYRVVIPAAANQYLTSSPSINLVNSLMFNAGFTDMNADELVRDGMQQVNHSGPIWETDVVSGLPALAKSGNESAGQAVVFFDTDTIVAQSCIAEKSMNIGQVYEELFKLDMNNLKTNKYSFKVEPTGYDTNMFDALKVSAETKTAFNNTLTSTSQLINIVNGIDDVDVLNTLISYKNGEVLELFDDPVVVAVQLSQGSEGSKVNYVGLMRYYYNYMYQKYIKETDTIFGHVGRQDVLNIFSNYTDFIASGKMMQGAANGGGVSPGDALYMALIGKKHPNAEKNALGTYFYGVNKVALGFLAESGFYEVTNATKLSVLDPDTGPFDSYADKYISVIENYQFANKSAYEKEGLKLRSSVSTSGESLQGEDERTWAHRLIKVYPTSEVMLKVANILGVRDGTEFAVYATNIYLTYLDWYGVTNNTLATLAGEKNMSKLNERIFDSSSNVSKVDINAISEGHVPSKEQKQEQVMDWTYMMLNPTAGREYRQKMITSAIEDWLYNDYQRLVYGSASSYYNYGSGVTTSSATNFLTIPAYADNQFTAPLINNYAKIAIVLIGIYFVITILVGVIGQRKVSWFIISVIMVVNVILVMPSTGEIVPLIANNVVQDMFSDKMTFWSLSEGITNAQLESGYLTGNTLSAGYLGNLSVEEQNQVIGLVKTYNILYLDRSLNLKQDISKKVTQTSLDMYDEVQSLKSARWMLPMIMRQFTAEDNSANYVYVPLGDKMDDLSNMYWYYNPSDAEFVKTVNAAQTGGGKSGNDSIPKYEGSFSTGLIDKQLYAYDGYSRVFEAGLNEMYDYHQYSYTIQGEGNYSSNGESENVHTYSYMIDSDKKTLLIPKYPTYGSAITGSNKKIESFEDWQDTWVASIKTSITPETMSTIEQHIENVAGDYDRFDRSTMDQVYGYLWATENPLHYFYDGIKQSFEEDGSLGSLAGQLTGNIATAGDDIGLLSGTHMYDAYLTSSGVLKDELPNVRVSFMHAGTSGYVRDILDLEHMFKNMLPYLYGVQLAALEIFPEDDMIEDYATYTCNEKSWLFRSNWVTKIIENPDYNKPSTIGVIDANGDKVNVQVKNMTLPSEYVAAGREMVFSEAQMHHLGLNESDLSIVELKCIEVNKAVSRKWTYLINYVAVEGITREVMLRQMAVDAVIEFNAAFSPTGVLNAAYTMYPNGLDLRAISFDSIMKMLMLNATRDASYIYGDTMATFVSDYPISTSILLYVVTFLCIACVPFVRNLTLAGIFYFGFFALLRTLLKDNKVRMKVSAGYTITNVILLVINLLYIGAFKLLMKNTTIDEVLSLDNISVNMGSPVGVLILILILDILFIASTLWFTLLIIGNHRGDMGMSLYSGIASGISGAVSGAVEKVGNRLNGLADSGRDSAKQFAEWRQQDYETKKWFKFGKKDGSDDEDSSSTTKKSKTSSTTTTETESSAHTDTRHKDSDTDSTSIDEEIDKGREIEKQEKQEKAEEIIEETTE